MTKKDKTALVEGLKKLSKDFADLAAVREGTDSKAKAQEAPAKEPSPVPEEAPQTELQVEEETPFLLKAASDLLPQSEEYQELVRLKEEVEQQSGGGMEVQLYPGSPLGTQDVILEGLRTGTVEMAVLPLSSLGQISPGITGFLAPFGGMDHDTAAAYCESAEMEECLQTIREETGIRVIAMAVKGNRNIWTRQQIESAEDLQNLP